MIEKLTSLQALTLVIFGLALLIVAILVVLKVEKETPTVRDDDEFLGIG